MRYGCRFVTLLAFLLVVGSAVAEMREAVSVPVAGGRSLSGEIFLPDSTVSAPGVLVLHTAAGSVESFDSDYARSLAKAGYVALAINFLHPETFNGRFYYAPAIVGDLVEAAKWLAARPEVRGKPIGTVGFSLGSIGLMVSARNPDIKAVVVYYGAYDVRKYRRGANPDPTRRFPIDDAGAVGAACLLLHGEVDDEVPLADAQGMKAALAAANKTVELVTYPGAYHRFDRGPVASMRSEMSPRGHTYRRNESAEKDAFSRTLSWLKKYLGP